MKQDLEKYKYTNEILVQGVLGFQKKLDETRKKLEDQHLTNLALEERMKEADQKFHETEKQLKEFNRLKSTAI